MDISHDSHILPIRFSTNNFSLMIQFFDLNIHGLDKFFGENFPTFSRGAIESFKTMLTVCFSQIFHGR